MTDLETTIEHAIKIADAQQKYDVCSILACLRASMATPGDTQALMQLCVEFSNARLNFIADEKAREPRRVM